MVAIGAETAKLEISKTDKARLRLRQTGRQIDCCTETRATMGAREEYEARKAAQKAREQQSAEQQEHAARLQETVRRETELRAIWFFRHPDKLVKYTGWLQLYTAVLSAATAALVGATIYSAIVLRHTDEKIGEQVAALRNQLTLAHPPRLLVTNIILYTKGESVIKPPKFTSGETIVGEVTVVNTGREIAKIYEPDAVCVPYWANGPLPMVKRGVGECGQLIAYSRCPIKDDQNRFVFCAGDIASWKFETVVPDNWTEFYVMGHLIFRDRLETRRATLFARKYDSSEQRFVPVKDNQAYESEE